ncbi:MAG: zinc ribbon domain-containing protein [Acidimicrobiales bacterium]
MSDPERADVDDEGGPVRFMSQPIALDYAVSVSPLAHRFGEQLREGRIVGQRCPQCELVFVPPRAFCAMCVVAMGPEAEVDLAEVGTVTAYTVLTPIQYHGQKEREEYALASVLIDGANGTVGQQRLVDLPLDEIRTGVRVEAVWVPADERQSDPGDRGYGFGNAIRGWRPNGEPDVPAAAFAEHVL